MSVIIAFKVYDLTEDYYVSVRVWDEDERGFHTARWTQWNIYRRDGGLVY